MSPQRKAAESRYKAARKEWDRTSSGTDLAAWELAEASLETARRELAQAEVDFPTAAENAAAEKSARHASRWGA